MPENKPPDISLKDNNLGERVSEPRKNFFRAMPEMCIGRPRLIIRFDPDNGLFNQGRISILNNTKTYRYVLENSIPIIRQSRTCEKRADQKKQKNLLIRKQVSKESF